MSHWDAPASSPEPFPPASGSNRKTLGIVLGIVGGLVLLIVLGCAGLIYWGMGMYREIEPVRVAAEGFLDRLSSGQLDDAWSDAAPAFQEKVDRAAFKGLVAKYPALSNVERRTMTGLRVNQTPAGTRGLVQFQLSGGKNSALVALVLVKVGDRWRVESLNIP